MVSSVVGAALVSALGGIISSRVGNAGIGGSDWNYREHRQLWTERLRFNQDSFRARNNLADWELTRQLDRERIVDEYMRSKSLADAVTNRTNMTGDSQTLREIALLNAITNRRIRGDDFTQQLGMRVRGFNQQTGFNDTLFNQNQYFEGLRLNTEAAGRSGQRGQIERQRLNAMFPEASPWDLLGIAGGGSGGAAVGQGVVPGYPSAASANVAAGPSPRMQMRAAETASLNKLASQLLPTPAVKAAQASAHAQMYSATVHAMSGLAQAMIQSRAPLQMADVAAKKSGSEISYLNKRGQLAAVQAGTEAGKQNLLEQDTRLRRQDVNLRRQDVKIRGAEANQANKFFAGRADYESNRTKLGYGQLGVSGLGVLQANRMLNKFGGALFGQADKVTKKLSGARKIKSSASAEKQEFSDPDPWKSIRAAQEALMNR